MWTVLNSEQWASEMLGIMPSSLSIVDTIVSPVPLGKGKSVISSDPISIMFVLYTQQKKKISEADWFQLLYYERKM